MNTSNHGKEGNYILNRNPIKIRGKYMSRSNNLYCFLVKEGRICWWRSLFFISGEVIVVFNIVLIIHWDIWVLSHFGSLFDIYNMKINYINNLITLLELILWIFQSKYSYYCTNVTIFTWKISCQFQSQFLLFFWRVRVDVLRHN